MAIHDRGLQHNDFSLRNIAVDNAEEPKRLVILDFEDAKPHECHRQNITLYTFPPDVHEFGCDELSTAARALEVWTPCTYLHQHATFEVRLTTPS